MAFLRGLHHRWQRFMHKYGLAVFVVFVVAAVVAGVAFLMVMLTDPAWLARQRR